MCGAGRTPRAQRLWFSARVAAASSPSLCVLSPQLDHVDPRAVQLGTLLVRGLTTLVLVNSACGFPWKTLDFMPWNLFDGKLFHQKYLQSEKGYTAEALVEQHVSSQFSLRLEKVGLKSVAQMHHENSESSAGGQKGPQHFLSSRSFYFRNRPQKSALRSRRSQALKLTQKSVRLLVPVASSAVVVPQASGSALLKLLPEPVRRWASSVLPSLTHFKFSSAFAAFPLFELRMHVPCRAASADIRLIR